MPPDRRMIGDSQSVLANSVEVVAKDYQGSDSLPKDAAWVRLLTWSIPKALLGGCRVTDLDGFFGYYGVGDT